MTSKLYSTPEQYGVTRRVFNCVHVTKCLTTILRVKNEKTKNKM